LSELAHHFQSECFIGLIGRCDDTLDVDDAAAFGAASVVERQVC
jgi:hypothetical protein